MQVFQRLICILALPLSLAATTTPLPDGVEYIETHDGIESYRLTSNDLRILLMPSDGLPVATVMVTYKVGSRNESAGTTGATHILEHMMFKGTPKFNPEMENSYSILMEQIGARSNATTWFDRTNYFATIPSQYVPLTIELEADRMRNLRIEEDDLASEMTVVRNEYERGENSPVRTLIKEIFAAAFMAHPYGHPTIGWQSDIESTSTDKLRVYYDTYYWPENAVVTIIGSFDRSETLATIAKHYGSIPRPAVAIPEVETTEPPQIGPRRVTIHRAGQVGVIMKGFKVPEATHPDWPALILIDQIVGADKTGRLYRALEDKGKASATFTFAPELRDPGLFVFGAFLTPEAQHEEVEAILKEEIERLVGGGVTEDELKRAKSVIRAAMVYGRDGPYAIASQINDAIATGDWKLYTDRPKDIESVSAEEIRKVAEKYFKESQQTTGWFIPEKKNSLALNGTRMAGPNYFRDPEIFGEQYNATEEPGVVTSATRSPVNFSDSIQKAEVNGIEIVAIDLPIEGVVSFVGSFAAGETMSPLEQPMLAGLTASMLDKGTQTRDRFEIAELLDTLGANISFAANPHSLSFSGQFLRPDAGPVLELAAEQLREPAFNEDVFDTLKARQRANILSAIDNTDYRAEAELSRQLYPKGHPNYTIEIETMLEGLDSTTIADLTAFHAEYYGPKSMRLVFAGDIDFEQLLAATEIAFENWEGGVPYPNDTPNQIPNKKGNQRIYIADKTSVSVHAGYNTGLQRTNPDYLPFMLGNYILGGSFHSRLMSEIRKEKGLTYSIRSFHQGDILTEGNWKLTASFGPSLLKQGLEATEDVIRGWYDQGVSDEEVEKAIQTLNGSYLVGLSTTSRIAGQVHSFMQRGYDAEYIDQYPSKLQNLTAADVNQAIKDYFDPDTIRIVTAGSMENSSSTELPQGTEKVTVRMDTPDAGWSVVIEAIYQTADKVIALSKLTRKEGMAAQVISTVTDSVTVPISPDLPVAHFVIGKSWDWGDTGDYVFLDSADELASELEGAELIYTK